MCHLCKGVHMSAGAHEDQKRASDLLEQELQVVVNCQTCGGNWILVLGKSSVCS